MARREIGMDIIKQIKLLSAQDIGAKTIARQLGLSKNTVKNYLKKEKNDLEPEQSKKDRTNHLEPFLAYCKEELKRKGVTRQILWAEYLQSNTGGYSYSHFCYYLQQYLQSNHATLHIEQQPGDRLYIDFAGQKLSFVDIETGEIKEVELFVSVLGYSGGTRMQEL